MDIEQMDEPMNTQLIHERVTAIEDQSADPESAHAALDALYQDVLTAIAAGAAEPAELAREALKAGEVDFPRWYA